MEFKGTQGEWYINKDCTQSNIHSIECKGETIACTCHCPSVRSDDETLANVHLIAAAPELLQASAECLNYIDKMLEGDNAFWCFDYEALVELRRAINKAFIQ